MKAQEIVSKYGFNIVFRRWVATWIDFIVLGALLCVPDGINHQFYLSTQVVWIGLFLAYFPVLEGTTGYTLGKLVARTKVVNEDCKPIGVKQSIIRSLLRLFEVNPLVAGGLPAALIVLFTKKKQRLGDILAHTYVVKVKDLQ
jgi:uncharacterized RDD family membrane protein YckC